MDFDKKKEEKPRNIPLQKDVPVKVFEFTFDNNKKSKHELMLVLTRMKKYVIQHYVNKKLYNCTGEYSIEEGDQAISDFDDMKEAIKGLE